MMNDQLMNENSVRVASHLSGAGTCLEMKCSLKCGLESLESTAHGAIAYEDDIMQMLGKDHSLVVGR